eukprot:6293720-Amphidinium_carterae.2
MMLLAAAHGGQWALRRRRAGSTGAKHQDSQKTKDASAQKKGSDATPLLHAHWVRLLQGRTSTVLHADW